MYLFDTNILSEALKKKTNQALLNHLSTVSGDFQFTSCICVMELRYGARRRADYETFWRRIERELLSMVTILPIDEGTALIAGDTAAELSRKGVGISPEDLLIACSAIQGNMTLVTANTR